jgi:hypothetical protein
MADHSQKSMRNDGQKTAIYLGKGKYFSHFLRLSTAEAGISPVLRGRVGLCISCLRGLAKPAN